MDDIKNKIYNKKHTIFLNITLTHCIHPQYVMLGFYIVLGSATFYIHLYSRELVETYIKYNIHVKQI